MRAVPFLRLLTAAAAVLALAACGAEGGSTATTTASTSTTVTTTTSTTSTTAGPTTAPSGNIVTGCRGGGAIPPAGAETRTVVDVDGDGRADRGWISTDDRTGKTTFGIDTAAGLQSTVDFDSASPVERAALVVNADETGPVEIILSDGRMADLYAYSGCQVRPVLNVQGKTYAFDLGFGGVGTGVGCVDTPEGRRLVGLDGGPGTETVTWSSTVIELEGLRARNGTITRGTYHRPGDDAAIARLHEITCGDVTMQRDGIIERG